MTMQSKYKLKHYYLYLNKLSFEDGDKNIGGWILVWLDTISFLNIATR